MRLKRTTGSQFIVSVVASILAVFLNYVITLVLTPYITENIGTEAYGFVSLAKTFANYASIFTVALNGFSARYISIEYHKGDMKDANTYYNSVFIADLIIGVLIFAVAIIVIFNLDKFLSIPSKLVADVKMLFLLDTINFLILSCSTAFMTATTIKNRLEIGSWIKCISYVLEALFLVIVYKMLPPNVYYVGLGLIVSSAAILVLNIYATVELTPELKIQKGLFSRKAVRELVKPGIWSSINSLGNTLNSGLDLLITNIMLSALQAGQLAIVETISTIFSTLFSILATPYQPIQLKYYAEGDKEKLVQSFKLGIKFNGMISNIAFAGFAIFGAAYYKLWTPGQNITLLQSVSTITILGCIIQGAVYPLYYGYNLTLKNKVPCIITIISGLLNLTSMYFLIKYTNLGLYAVVGTTTVLSWLGDFIFNPMYLSHCLGLRKATFYPTLFRHIFSCLIMTFSFWGISKIFWPKTWIQLIFIAILCAFIGAVIHIMVVMNKTELRQGLHIVLRRK